MRKCTTLTMAISSVFFIIPAFANNNNFSPFISILFGRQIYMSDEQTKWSGNINGDTHYHYGIDNFSSELALGANQSWNKLSLGTEAFYDLIPIHNKFTSQSDNPTDNYTIRQNLRNTFGIRMLPGYLFTQSTLVYIPIGWANSQFSLSSNAPNNVPSYNQRINGLQLGLGIDEAINEKLRLRLEYINTSYRNFSINYQGDTQIKNRRYSLSMNQFNIGFAYYLNSRVSSQIQLTQLSDGWYTGIGAGKSIQTAVLNIRDIGFHQIQNLSSSGLLGNVFFGFDHQFASNFYFGTEAELFLDNAAHQQSMDLDDGELLKRQIKMKYSYNLSVLPGYQIAQNFRLYSRLGFAQGDYQYQTHLGNHYYDQTKMLNGIVLGLGGELALAKQWAIRGEYQETRYQSLSKHMGTVNESARPHSHYYLLNIIYYFK